MQLNKMLKEAQKLQSQMAEMQDKVAQIEIEGSSGGGMVRVKISGNNITKGLHIDPSLINVDEKEILEDLIIAAINDARQKLDQKTQEEMSKISTGLSLPGGMKLPF